MDDVQAIVCLLGDGIVLQREMSKAREIGERIEVGERMEGVVDEELYDIRARSSSVSNERHNYATTTAPWQLCKWRWTCTVRALLSICDRALCLRVR